MRKIRILGIAPYEGIATLMEHIASKRDDVDLKVFIGDLQNGAAIAKKYASEGYDIILSRGGTAEMIQALNLLPVVNISISIYDIFRSIRLADNSQQKYAIIGFPSITRNAIFLKDMLQSHMPVYTIHDSAETQNTLKELKAAGYEMVVCDVLSSSIAAYFNLTSILISSGEESITSAFDIAVQIVTQRLAISDENALYKEIIENEPYPVVVYTPDGTLFYQSLVTPLPENICNILKNKISSVIDTHPQKFHYEYSGLLYAIIGKKFTIKGKKLVVYYINKRKVPLVLSKNGIRYTNLEQAQNDFQNSFYRISNINSSCLGTLEKYLESSLPLAILGEPGTGKEALAKYSYVHSPLSSSPMSILDCAKFNEKLWNFLTCNHNSPLSDTNTTIYIKNIHTLSDDYFYELLNILDDLKLYRRNHIIFTIDTAPGEAVSERILKLINNLHCLTLETAPLTDNMNDLPNIISLYINHLNILYGKNIIGLEPEALTLLQSFHWSHNYDQFIRIITELVLSCVPPVITTAATKQVLKKETGSPAFASEGTFSVDFSNKTLDEINLEIIRQILLEEGGNQSRTAKRLGISRSTLWRMLQK